MSAHTQARKRHAFGRSFLHKDEARIGIPWYMSQKWSEKKAVIALRIKKIEERAHVRRLERLDSKNVSRRGVYIGNGKDKQKVVVEKSFLSRVLGK